MAERAGVTVDLKSFFFVFFDTKIGFSVMTLSSVGWLQIEPYLKISNGNIAKLREPIKHATQLQHKLINSMVKFFLIL